MFSYDTIQGSSNNDGNESILNNNISENCLLDGL